MNKENCRYEEHCEAYLCPLDDDIDNYVWYVEEPVCRNAEFSNLRWINRQRALRKNKKNEDIGFFNKKMLEVLGRVTRKTKGIDTRLVNQEKAIDEWVQRCLRKKSLRVQTAIISANGAIPVQSPRPAFPTIFFIGVNLCDTKVMGKHQIPASLILGTTSVIIAGFSCKGSGLGLGDLPAYTEEPSARFSSILKVF